MATSADPTHPQSPPFGSPSTTLPRTKTRPAKNSRREHLLARKQSLKATITALKNERNTLVNSTLAAASNNPTTTKISKDDQDRNREELSEEQILESLHLANQKIKSHIRDLQRYNEVKDIGTQLMGMIAEKKGVRIVEVQREFGVEGND